MGGKSKSSQSTSQTDNRRVLGDGAISAEGSNLVGAGGLNIGGSSNLVTVQTLDAEVANSALSMGKYSLDKALNFSLNANSQALDSLNTTANLVKDAYAESKGRGAWTDQILIGSVVMAGLVALAALKKG